MADEEKAVEPQKVVETDRFQQLINTGMFNTQFNDEYQGGFWDAIRFWLFRREVRRQKLRALWEANIDKYYFETEMREFINYDDTADRKFLQNESFKPEQDRDKVRITEIEDRIATSKSLKGAYRKNEAFREDVKTYLEMLNSWGKQN